MGADGPFWTLVEKSRSGNNGQMLGVSREMKIRHAMKAQKQTNQRHIK
jgi:hypothetical protein